MRMSCNGCRVLRKGCGDDCSIRSCLQWIKSPDSQAHATVFLAKFYGRAGLMNLINAGPEHLRPAIFRSLLYEACGRILNPIYGSVGLLWDGSWQLCHAAMEAVLSGVPITPIASEAAAPPLKAYDIRHIPRQENPAAAAAMMAAVGEANRARPIRSGRFKRPGARTKAQRHPAPPPPAVEWRDEESNRSPSHDSSLSHQSVLGAPNAGVGFGGGDSKETESNSMVSAETTTTTVAEPPQPLKPEPEPESAAAAGAAEREDGASAEPESEVGLELTLGFKPASREDHVIPVKKRRFEQRDEACSMELGL